MTWPLDQAHWDASSTTGAVSATHPEGATGGSAPALMGQHSGADSRSAHRRSGPPSRGHRGNRRPRQPTDPAPRPARRHPRVLDRQGPRHRLGRGIRRPRRAHSQRPHSDMAALSRTHPTYQVDTIRICPPRAGQARGSHKHDIREPQGDVEHRAASLTAACGRNRLLGHRPHVQSAARNGPCRSGCYLATAADDEVGEKDALAPGRPSASARPRTASTLRPGAGDLRR
jgi:hypothetical protein